jgi:hypothetical protein
MRLRERDEELAQAKARLAEAATRAQLMPANSSHAGWWPAPSRRGPAPR